MMFFGNKNKKNKHKCEDCGSWNKKSHNFCPRCGNSLMIENEEDFGLLGKSDIASKEEEMFSQLGFMDRTLMTMLNSLMKNLDSQMRTQMRDFDGFGKTEVKRFPNGIRIKILNPMEPRSAPKQKVNVSVEREIPSSQLKKMNSLPREKAKANMKRIGDKVIYELSTPGVNSPNDVFVSKLESGYEIKAIGDKKVYINSLPINLPLRSYSIVNNKLLVEFLAGNEARNFVG